MKTIFNFARQNKFEFLLLIIVLLVGASMRLWRIDEYLTFLGDEGRDALVVMRFLRHGDPILIGPPTSVGNMLLGPLYYWMMIPAMFVSGLSPIGPAVGIALLGVATIFLVYRSGKDFFGSPACGLFAASLYAISPVTIFYFRSSWNPNPLPFFALVSTYSFFKVLTEKKYFWIAVSFISLAFALQMHYLGAILIPILGLFWLVSLIRKVRDKNDKGLFWLFSAVGFFAFLLLMSPLLFFDLRHNFINFQAFKTFFVMRETTINLNFLNSVSRVVPNFLDLFVVRFVTGRDQFIGILLSISILLTSLVYIVRQIKEKYVNWGFFILIIWFLTGIAGISLYKQHVYDHYFGFMNPTIFLLAGLFLGFLFTKRRKLPHPFQFLGKISAIIIFLSLLVLNLQESPLKYPPNKQLQRTQKITQFVINESQGEPFNFALIANGNYDPGYRYYLELWDHPPVGTSFEQTNQFYVVCEDPVCNPVGSSDTEIARFGWAAIEKIWNVSGVKLYKLGHNPTGGLQKTIPTEVNVSL